MEKAQTINLLLDKIAPTQESKIDQQFVTELNELLYKYNIRINGNCEIFFAEIDDFILYHSVDMHDRIILS